MTALGLPVWTALVNFTFSLPQLGWGKAGRLNALALHFPSSLAVKLGGRQGTRVLAAQPLAAFWKALINFTLHLQGKREIGKSLPGQQLAKKLHFDSPQNGTFWKVFLTKKVEVFVFFIPNWDYFLLPPKNFKIFCRTEIPCSNFT